MALGPAAEQASCPETSRAGKQGSALNPLSLGHDPSGIPSPAAAGRSAQATSIQSGDARPGEGGLHSQEGERRGPETEAEARAARDAAGAEPVVGVRVSKGQAEWLRRQGGLES